MSSIQSAALLPLALRSAMDHFRFAGGFAAGSPMLDASTLFDSSDERSRHDKDNAGEVKHGEKDSHEM